MKRIVLLGVAALAGLAAATVAMAADQSICVNCQPQATAPVRFYAPPTVLNEQHSHMHAEAGHGSKGGAAVGAGSAGGRTYQARAGFLKRHKARKAARRAAFWQARSARMARLSGGGSR